MTVVIEPGYVKLIPQRPTTMRADRWEWQTRQITDPLTRQLKTVRVMVLHITELDGAKTDTTFSTLSTKLQADLAPLIDSGMLFARRFSITHNPRGYATEYTVALL